ncbi:hypothetical protein RJ639_041137 [Escallonia herrerae]|uniref:Integrase catalytic domain-containing protein n=1 Tax=Escallonia herrerae TaxID=1293975 RepID=A0AA88WHJ2_9ASTE|nr:hypothetical protein RJ639_041137 [Escallonia herrerae]
MASKDASVGASGMSEENLMVMERGRDPLPPAGGKKVGLGQSKSRDAIASLDGRACILEEAMGDVKDRLGMVEQNLQTLEDHVLEELESLKKAVINQDELRTRFMQLFANLQEQLDVVKVGMEETRPKPKEFGGKRDAKELDNFIWHMERYFEGASITDEKANRCQTAFEGLKEAVTEEPVLALPDHAKVFEVQTDASDFAIGGVLMQEGHPIVFESRKLNDTERKYMVQEKEMTAVVYCLRTWRSEGCGSIMVVVDRFSKYATFVAAPADCTAEDAARLFLKYVVKYWGLPKIIVSDRDPRFTGKFWTELFKLLGSELHFSTSFHPQTDGQTERVNALLECYLRHFVSANQTDWARLLDVAQFSYNLMRSEATNQSPFEIAIGQQPLTPLALADEEVGGQENAAEGVQPWGQGNGEAASATIQVPKEST